VLVGEIGLGVDRLHERAISIKDETKLHTVSIYKSEAVMNVPTLLCPQDYCLLIKYIVLRLALSFSRLF
jgi:hypothetical protein